MDIFAIAGFGTNFMFSLGIIFIIIFVVFYIRQRLSNFDHKLNSMFQLINAMADEMNNMKSSSPNATMSNERMSCVPNGNGMCMMDPMKMMSMLNPPNNRLIEVSDDESSDDESSDDESSDEDNNDDTRGGNDRQIAISSDVVDSGLVFDEITKISEYVEPIHDSHPPPSPTDDALPTDDASPTDDALPIFMSPYSESSKIIPNIPTFNFKKMSMKDLRDYITDNNLAEGDISKLKKNELIELCK